MDVRTLDPSTTAIQKLCAKDKRLAKVISMVGPITYVPYDDGFPFLVHEIIEQMISIKAGRKIFGRLTELCDGTISAEKLHAMEAEEIQTVGMSRPKAAYIKNLADAIVSSSLDLASLSTLDDKSVTKTLTSIKGIGQWTAKMYLIFVLDRPNVLPFEDGAFLQTYKWMYKTDDVTPAAVKKKCKKWSPYASIGARYLYRALDMGLTKQEFHLFK